MRFPDSPAPPSVVPVECRCGRTWQLATETDSRDECACGMIVGVAHGTAFIIGPNPERQSPPMVNHG